MTEAEWLACADPSRMFFEFGLCSNHRKTRLLFAANCRRGWNRLSDVSHQAVEIAERFADGSGTPGELAAIDKKMREECSYILMILDHDVSEEEIEREERLLIGLGAAQFAAATVWPEYRSNEPFTRQWEGLPDERRPDAHLTRDIFGNPFRPAAFSPEWRTTTAVALAAQMYESREFGAMPILADALQDAGCDNAGILDHCREPSAHVRGCWVVDLVLGKE